MRKGHSLGTRPSPVRATKPDDKWVTGVEDPSAPTVPEFSLLTHFHVRFSGRGCLHSSAFYFTH